jgi:shingomyelin synthase
MGIDSNSDPRPVPESPRLCDTRVEDLSRAQVIPSHNTGADEKPATPATTVEMPAAAAAGSTNSRAAKPSFEDGDDKEKRSGEGVIVQAVAHDSDDEDEPSILPFVYLPASKVYVGLPWQCFAFVWLFLFTMFFLCMVLTATTWRYPDPDTQHQLPDIALDNLPEIPELEHVTDLLLAFLEVMCFVTIFLLYLVKQGKLKAVDPRRLRALEPLQNIHMVPWIRFFVCFTAITAMRIIVVGATVLPSTNNQCKTRPDTGNFWWNSLVGVLSFGGSNIHCGDLLFSGHTAVITLSVCAIWQYGPIVSNWFRTISGFLMLCSWFTILASRSHYTDDIVIAFYIGVTLWLLTPHDPIHGAPAIWQLFIQNPYRIYCAIVEATAERAARRAARVRGPNAV